MTTTNDIISKALSILKGHDFYWMMDDYAYTNGGCNRAKASMRHYVETITQLPADLYDLMKRLWIAEYDYCSCFRPFYTSDEAPARKEAMDALRAEVEAIINPIAIAA